MMWLIDKRFTNRVKLRFEKYDIQVGILVDKPHYKARSQWKKTGRGKNAKLVQNHTSVEGMKARKKTGVRDNTMVGVSRLIRNRTGINIYRAPFQSNPSSEVKKFRRALFNFFGAKNGLANKRKAAEVALVEAVRAPIRRRKYGPNSQSTIKTKGFNRLMFDTGQLFKAIRAKIKRLPGGGKNYGPFQ